MTSSFTRKVAVLLCAHIVSGCAGGSVPVVPVDTDGDSDSGPVQLWTCADLESCFSVTAVRLDTSQGALGGHDIGVTSGTSRRLVLSAPNQPDYMPETGSLSLIALFEVDPAVEDIEVPTAYVQILAYPIPRPDGTYPPYVTRMGSSLVLPGDVTGDGEPDLVTLSDVLVDAVPGVRVFPGPFGPPMLNAPYSSPPYYADSPSVPVGDAGTSLDGARCGDLNSDGVDDLVLDDGIVLGPIVADLGALARDYDLGGRVFEIDDRAAPGCIWVGAGEVKLLSAVTSDGPVTATLYTTAGMATAAHFTEFAGNLVSALALTESGAHRVEVRTTPTADPLVVPLTGEATAVLWIDLDEDGTPELMVGTADALTVYDAAGAPRGVWSTPRAGRRPVGYRLMAADVVGDQGKELVVANPWGGYVETGEVYVFALPLTPPGL